MKATGLVLAVGALLMGLVACSTRAADKPNPAEEIEALRAENNMLKRQRTDLVERAKSLEQEVERMKALLKDAGIDLEKAATGLPAKPPEAETYMYLGKPRSKVWFEGMYKMFADKIVVVDGKAFDVGGKIDSMRGDIVPEVGSCFLSPDGAKVLSVISNSECLVIRHGHPAQSGRYGQLLMGGMEELLFHVKGMTASLVDDVDFPNTQLVCVGTYRYGTTLGAAKTVPSYAVCMPITREQFAEALSGGFKLMNYRKVTTKTPEGTNTKIVGTPVP